MENKVLPTHVGFIVDGNGRWATKRGLSRSMGHKQGAENIKRICLYMNELGIPYISIYAFSTENFKRNTEEVNFLMDLFVHLFTKEFQELMDKNVKVVFSGRKEPLPKKVLDAMDFIQKETKDNTGSVLNICINYGSQSEILDMTKKIATLVKENRISIEEIDETCIFKNLYQELPPLDFVIRTSGEKRLSNFMLLQASYAELYFPETPFPDFTEKDFDLALEEYNHRTRKFGGY